MNFDTDVCFYTRDKARLMLYSMDNFLPKVLCDMIIDYCCIYRDNHMKPYAIESSLKNKILFNRILKNEDKCILQIIYSARLTGKTTMLQDYVLAKEIEWKESTLYAKKTHPNPSFNILFLFFSRSAAEKVCNAFLVQKSNLKESWMMHEQLITTKDMIKSKNGFNVYFNEEYIPKTSDIDVLIVDEFAFCPKHEEFKYFFNKAKYIIMISTINDNNIENTMEQWINYIPQPIDRISYSRKYRISIIDPWKIEHQIVKVIETSSESN